MIMDNSSNGFKGVMAVTAFGYYILCSVTEIVIATVFLMVTDFITGVLAAFVIGTISVQIARDGFLKKFGYFLLIVTAFVLDFVTYYMTSKIGLSINTQGMFGICTCIWLIGTEVLSISDNLKRSGVPIPPFILAAGNKIKKVVEEAQQPKKESEDEKI